MCSEVDGDVVFGADVGVMSEHGAHAAAATPTGLIAALLVVHARTHVRVACSKHVTGQDIARGRIEY